MSEKINNLPQIEGKFKSYFEETVYEGIDWFRTGLIVSFLVSVIGEQLLDRVSKYQLLKKDHSSLIF
jgi:hypothetical protein